MATQSGSNAVTFSVRYVKGCAYAQVFDLYVNSFVDFTFLFFIDGRQVSFYEFRKHVRLAELSATPKDIEGFKQRLAGRSHDKYYQTIALPYGQTIGGYERTVYTWDKFAKTINFRGKTVLDAGCYHCYVAFGAEDSGAKSVTGLDCNRDVIDTSSELARIWGYETKFICEDLNTWVPLETYDIVICSNVIHHAKNPEHTIAMLFGAGDWVVWEAHEKFKPIFDQQLTHQLFLEEESARTAELSRRLYYYKRK